MLKVKLGTRVKPLGIQRVSCGDGQKCRVVLLDPDPRVKYIAYDEKLKVRVEVDQDMVIKFGFRPFTTFYYLVAKLNTDLNGNIIGDQFTVEYLQLSENLNNELSDQITEQGVPKSLAISHVKKIGDGGKDFSYIKPTPSQVDIDGSLRTSIDAIRSNAEFIDQCWDMIDASTSKTKDQYLQLLQAAKDTETGRPQIPSEQPAKRLPDNVTRPTATQPVMPQAPTNFIEGNDFGSDDDFSM